MLALVELGGQLDLVEDLFLPLALVDAPHDLGVYPTQGAGGDIQHLGGLVGVHATVAADDELRLNGCHRFEGLGPFKYVALHSKRRAGIGQ